MAWLSIRCDPGNIRFIGELYKRKLIAEPVMHACILHLLRNILQSTEEDIECALRSRLLSGSLTALAGTGLCKLIGTVGKTLEAASGDKFAGYMTAIADVRA